MITKSEKMLTAALLLFVIVLLGMAGNHDVELEKQAFLRYCEEVRLYRETDGEQGWRDWRRLWPECEKVSR